MRRHAVDWGRAGASSQAAALLQGVGRRRGGQRGGGLAGSALALGSAAAYSLAKPKAPSMPSSGNTAPKSPKTAPKSPKTLPKSLRTVPKSPKTSPKSPRTSHSPTSRKAKLKEKTS